MNKQTVLEITDLSFTYPDGSPALKDIRLSLTYGETVVLLGPNGAGKSTLLLHMNGIFVSPNVKVMGLTATEKNLREIRRLVGLIFQDPDDQLFSPTVYDDVAFAPLNLGYSKTEIDERVEQALNQVNLNAMAQKPPHHLSFGEKKRASVATVMTTEPQLLVCDEPTSNLDPLNRRKMIQLLAGLPMAKIIATHDLEMAVDLKARIIVLDNGQIVADGKMKNILHDEELLARHGLELPWSFRQAETSV